MSIAYLNNGAVELPNVRAQQISWEVIADEGRTAGGRFRRDIVAIKRAWRLELSYLTRAQYDAIINYLNSVMFGAITFWLDEFGGAASTDSIDVYVDIESDERVQFGSNGTWHSQGHNLTLLVRER